MKLHRRSLSKRMTETGKPVTQPPSFFDTLAVTAFGNFCGGLISPNGSVVSLLVTLIAIRLVFFLAISHRLSPELELRVALISAVSWLIGNSLVKDHTWTEYDETVTRRGVAPDRPNIPRSIMMFLIRKLL